MILSNLSENLDFQYVMLHLLYNSRQKKTLLSEYIEIRFHAIRNMIFVVVILYDNVILYAAIKNL